MRLFDLKDKVALITGSTRGIGKAIAVEFVAHGARVTISSRKQPACDAVAQEIRAAGGAALPVACNAGSKEELQALVDATVAHYGRIDILVCNVGINPYYGPSIGVPDAAFDKIMGTNVRSTLWLCNMVLPQMAERNDGAVIIISSVAGIKGNDRLGIYGISKAAEMQLTRNLAVEWGPRNIRVNCLAPGVVRTEFARALWEDPKLYAQLIRQYPLRRIGEPEDIAGAAVFFASAAGRFVTGQTLVMDGGGTIGGSERVGE
jgi:NAD(P)-dependent dehydrogenase (short-subunit alcohol dehydrogenase family)